jgi:hypothetical protein
MQKRIFQVAVFAALFAICVLFTAGNATAQDECNAPLSCNTNPDSPEDGWTFSVVGDCPGQQTENCLNEAGESVPCWPCMYEVCKPGTGPNTNVECNSGNLNQVLIAVQKCCPEDIQFFPLTPDLSHPSPYPFGKGDPVFGWLSDYYQARALRFPPQYGDHIYGFSSSTRASDETTICVKSKKNLNCCQIKGLGCPDTEFALPAVSTKSLVATTDGREFKQLLDPATQCPTEIWELVPCIDGQACRPNGDCEPCEGDVYEWLLEKRPSDEILKAEHGDGTPAENITDVVNPGQGCPGAIVKSDSDNSWFFCFVGWCFF